VADVLEALVLGVAWAPLLLLLHELGHALAALALTDGAVKIGFGRGGVFGYCLYEPETLRSARAEVWIVAAGPAVSLAAAGVLWAMAWPEGLRHEAEFAAKVLMAGALTASAGFVASAVPMRYGAGLGGGESDGRAIWRILRGTPPSGVARAERAFARPQRMAHPAILVLLGLVAVLTLLVNPPLALGLVALFGWAAWIQKSDQR
jgi:hypothetical protein